MYRFLLTPRWWGINLFVVLAIPFCVFMGTWQLGRFEDRVQTHEAAEKQPAPGTRAAKPIDELLPVDTVTSGRPATATGRYADQFLVPGRKLDDRTGFYVVGMLRTGSGKALPVVRGWLPGKAGHTAVPPAPSGDVTVTGDLQASESTGTAGVDATGGLPDGQVGMISAASLVNLVPYDVYDAWVTLQRSDVRTGGAAATDTSGTTGTSGTDETAGQGGKATAAATALRPVPAAAAQGTGLDLKAFQNLGYLCEWFVFAAFVLFMWFRLVRREAEAVRDVRLGLVAAPDAAAPDEEATPDREATLGQETGTDQQTGRAPETAPDREATPDPEATPSQEATPDREAGTSAIS
ncbi:SURF1 family protein [Streptomyces sp. NPDC088726]|uniref:SURF1 family protein n=1 Tax=Streptomyces sp. NPDC088726 TaxID=3365874 RepID=UPI0038035B33